MATVGVATAVLMDAFLTAIHSSFSSLVGLSFSSSEVMLSASTPVVFLDLELDANEVVLDGVASPGVVAAGVILVDEVNVAVEESLFAVAAF